MLELTPGTCCPRSSLCSEERRRSRLWWRRLLISGTRNTEPGQRRLVCSLTSLAVGENLAGRTESQARTVTRSSAETGSLWPGLWPELYSQIRGK